MKRSTHSSNASDTQMNDGQSTVSRLAETSHGHRVVSQGNPLPVLGLKGKIRETGYRILTTILLTIAVSAVAHAGGHWIFDDFEDGDAADGQPFVWMVDPVGSEGTRVVIDGDYVMTVNGTPSNPVSYVLEAIHATGDVSVQTQLRILSADFSAASAGLFARSTNGSSYWAGVTAGGWIETGMTGSGIRSQNGHVPPVDRDVTLRLDVVGDTISVKAWFSGEAEPSTPILSFTDATFTSGTVGVYLQGLGRKASVAFRDFGVRAPVAVDFNGDGLVDGEDAYILVNHWQTDNELYDIAPEPWGDNIVDVQDLVLLSESFFQDVNDPTLAAHWALDETEGSAARDNVSGNDDYVLGGAVWQPDGGKIGGAIELDGIDDSIVSTIGTYSAETPFSVIAWIKGGAPGQAIISQSGGVDWLMIDSEGNLTTELQGSGRGGSPLSSQALIADGQWHRIGLVWDGSKRMLFVDGASVAEDMQDDLGTFGSGLFIGVGKDYAAGTFFSGLIDDVRIYNRVVSP